MNNQLKEARGQEGQTEQQKDSLKNIVKKIRLTGRRAISYSNAVGLIATKVEREKERMEKERI